MFKFTVSVPMRIDLVDDGSAADSEVRTVQKREAKVTRKEQNIPRWIPACHYRSMVPQVSPGRSPLQVEVVPVPHRTRGSQ